MVYVTILSFRSFVVYILEMSQRRKDGKIEIIVGK